MPPLLPLANASTTSLQIQIHTAEPESSLGRQHSRRSRSSETIAFTLTNTGDGVAMFVRLAMRETSGGPELPFAIFSDNFVCLLPGESYNGTGTFLAANDDERSWDVASGMVCAEAWNAHEHCAS